MAICWRSRSTPRAALSGQPATIASDVRVLEAQRAMMATVSGTGAIAWATPRATRTRFTWFGRDGGASTRWTFRAARRCSRRSHPTAGGSPSRRSTPPALGGHPLQISTGRGRVLAWRRDGKELLLVTFDDQIAGVTVDARGDSITAGQPTPLFRLPPNHGGVSVAPDADRFLIQEYPYQSGQTIRVLTNWHERIK